VWTLVWEAVGHARTDSGDLRFAQRPLVQKSADVAEESSRTWDAQITSRSPSPK
jgi:hypothetical protein